MSPVASMCSGIFQKSRIMPNYAEFTKPETDVKVSFRECKSGTDVACLLSCNRKFSVEMFVILVL